MAQHWVGTSGWSYANWQGIFYPAKLKRTAWLDYYAGRYATVEVNASFYHLPSEAMLEGWVKRTPDDFLFAVKAWRVLTHLRRLNDCAEPLATFLGRVEQLGAKGGPVLFQLPPKWGVNEALLANFLGLLPNGGRFAFEFRDPSWHTDDVYALLDRKNAAFVPFELGDLAAPRVATADFVYVRLHGRKTRYRGNYDDDALEDWAEWLKAQMVGGRDAYVYFDNTDEADFALKNARRLGAMLAG